MFQPNMRIVILGIYLFIFGSDYIITWQNVFKLSDRIEILPILIAPSMSSSQIVQRKNIHITHVFIANIGITIT